jgi:hypothetical protein
VLRRIDRSLAPVVAELTAPGRPAVEIEVAERPPMIEVAEYLQVHAPALVVGA